MGTSITEKADHPSRPERAFRALALQVPDRPISPPPRGAGGAPSDPSSGGDGDRPEFSEPDRPEFPEPAPEFVEQVGVEPVDP